MKKTDEELNQAEKMAKRHGVRLCDENGDTHGEELYCVGIDDIADIIREALAEQSKCACDSPAWCTKYKKCNREMLGLPKAEPVKQEPVAIVVEVDRHGDATVVSGAWQLDGGKHTFYGAPVSVEAAVLAEREACAEVCDRFAENEAGFVAEDCAAEIRARGEK